MMPPERVLGEMASLGLKATEIGPTGYLGVDAGAVAELVSRFDLRVVGAFVPVVLHDPSCREDTMRVASSTAEMLAATGHGHFVTAVVADPDWSPRFALDTAQWQHLFDGLDLLDDLCAAHHLTQILHPHVGTLVETTDDVLRTLEGSSVRWCLDTGHLTIGGVDPVAFATDHADRVAHVHLKDVDHGLADQYRGGELTFMQAVQKGLFRPLGRGDVAIGDVIGRLEGAAYQGWYVLEQDTAIIGDLPAAGTGPIDDVRVSVEYLQSLAVTTDADAVPVHT
jgi:inosose dehydratase